MAEKGIFVKFLSVLKKHFKAHYPFVKQLEKSLDASIPKSSSFYLGVSPKYNKHVIIKFLHENKPWRIGQVTISIHISTDFEKPSFLDVPDKEFEMFNNGRFSLPIGLTGKNKYWCLKPTTRIDDDYTIYWKPTSYESDEIVINEAIADVCALLEQLFIKAGFMEPDRVTPAANNNKAA